MKKYFTYGLQWLLVLFFIAQGIMKLTGNVATLEVFAGFGYTIAFMYFIGVCEILGALGIAFGTYVHTKLPRLATVGLSIIMIGAMYSHFSSGDSLAVAIPAIINLVLLGIYLKLLPKE